jgi:hypothetical protein
MTDETINPIYFCKGCESEVEDRGGAYKERYSKFEACPLCMTNEELYQLEYGDK